MKETQVKHRSERIKLSRRTSKDTQAKQTDTQTQAPLSVLAGTAEWQAKQHITHNANTHRRRARAEVRRSFLNLRWNSLAKWLTRRSSKSSPPKWVSPVLCAFNL